MRYADYTVEADAITKECAKFLAEFKCSKVNLVFKVNDRKKFEKSLITNLPTCLVANMLPSWQGKAASYSVGARFDARWKGWVRTGSVGEVQNITINLPRLALKAKDEAEFFKNLNSLLKPVLGYLSSMAEFVTGEFLKYRVNFNSCMGGRWDCTRIEDCSYFISIIGLDEAVYLLSGKHIGENAKLAEKILKECQKTISAYDKIPMRLDLKEETDENVANRFYNLDKKENIKVKKYSRGVNSDNYLASAGLHQLLLGGHCAFASKEDFDFDAFAKVKGGLVKLT